MFSLSGLAFFSILHVAMRLQRTEICVSFARAGFLKVVFSAVAGRKAIKVFIQTNHLSKYIASYKFYNFYIFFSALGSLLACIFGGVEFEVLGREARFSIDIGVCYYLQVIVSCFL